MNTQYRYEKYEHALFCFAAINCKPPDLQTEGASHMVYDCPSSYRYGANCSLSCKSGYPLGGANYIQCVKQDEYSDPPTLIWKEPQHQLKPFCKGTYKLHIRIERLFIKIGI